MLSRLVGEPLANNSGRFDTITLASAGFAPETGVMPLLKFSPAAILNQLLFLLCLNPRGLPHPTFGTNRYVLFTTSLLKDTTPSHSYPQTGS